jgi:hypothetical protein
MNIGAANAEKEAILANLQLLERAANEGKIPPEVVTKVLGETVEWTFLSILNEDIDTALNVLDLLSFLEGVVCLDQRSSTWRKTWPEEY